MSDTLNKKDLSDAAFLSDVSARIQGVASLLVNEEISNIDAAKELISVANLIDENNPIRRIDFNDSN